MINLLEILFQNVGGSRMHSILMWQSKFLFKLENYLHIKGINISVWVMQLNLSSKNNKNSSSKALSFASKTPLHT